MHTFAVDLWLRFCMAEFGSVPESSMLQGIIMRYMKSESKRMWRTSTL